MNAQQVFRARHEKHASAAMSMALLLILLAFVLSGYHEPVCPVLERLDEVRIIPQLIDPPQPTVIPPDPPQITRPDYSITEIVEDPALDRTDEPEEESFEPPDDATPPAPSTMGTEFTVYDKAPRPRRRVTPEYPPMARSAGIEGLVRCLVTIDEHGRVIRVVVVRSDANVFDDPTVSALERWTWFPAEQSGSPVRATVAVPVSFTLDR